MTNFQYKYIPRIAWDMLQKNIFIVQLIYVWVGVLYFIWQLQLRGYIPIYLKRSLNYNNKSQQHLDKESLHSMAIVQPSHQYKSSFPKRKLILVIPTTKSTRSWLGNSVGKLNQKFKKMFKDSRKKKKRYIHHKISRWPLYPSAAEQHSSKLPDTKVTAPSGAMKHRSSPSQPMLSNLFSPSQIEVIMTDLVQLRPFY